MDRTDLTADVIVVGAGVAGLAAARTLQGQGRTVVVLEATDRLGGRITTDEVDGFLVDRGFQVLNPAYKHVRTSIDVSRLGLRAFPRAVRVRTASTLVEIADPTRRPQALPTMIKSGLVSRKDLAAVRLLGALKGQDRSRREAFDHVGFSGPLRRSVVDPFLSGVVCERDGSTSWRHTAWLLGMFAAGTPGLPSGGMRTLPRVLAEGLDVRLGQWVTDLDGASGTVRTGEHGEQVLRASSVVVAAGPRATASLTGTPVPQMHSTRTFWFATSTAPSSSAAIHIDGRGPAGGCGPVATASVISNVAPEYAPAGQHLVAALTLTDDSDPSEEETRWHLGEIFGVDTSQWRLVATHDLPDTLPALAPGQTDGDKAVRRERLVLCGDQFGNASTDGALASGHRAAQLVAEILRSAEQRTQ